MPPMRPAPRKKILVAIFQRGAADGLNIVVPHGEKAYYDLRPTIAIPRPASNATGKRTMPPSISTASSACIPSLAPLKPLFDQRHLAIVHAAGSPDPTRSHFDAQDYMESGTPGLQATDSGWMNRALPRERRRASPRRCAPCRWDRRCRARCAGAQPGRRGAEHRRFPGARCRRRPSEFEQMYAASQGSRAAGHRARDVRSRGDAAIHPEAALHAGGGRAISARPLGDSLQQIAQLIKADVGVEMAFADIGGWDHHVNEVGPRASEGQLANLLRDFGQALSAFWTDLGDRMADVAVVTMSEFGRTAHENGNRGTDHGHANCMFVMGGDVKGGKVYGKWPGLEQEQLYEGRDLALTTDFRDVLGELVAHHIGQPHAERRIPGV